MITPRVWFITGSSTGFGRNMVEHVLSKGDIAIATLRKPEALDNLKANYSDSQLLVLKLDVTKPKDVTDAFARAKETFGRIDVVFNNAGYGFVNEVENAQEDAARAMFEVVFWGAERVSREAIKFFREVNKSREGGKLLNTSSMAGLRAFPGIGHYSAAKFALEGLSEALALELDPDWNIKVTIVEPGAFATPGFTHGMPVLPAHPAYTKPELGSNLIRNDFSSRDPLSLSDPMMAVKRIYEMSQLPEPPLRFLIGKDAVAVSRTQLKSIKEDTDKYESWSEGLEFVRET